MPDEEILPVAAPVVIDGVRVVCLDFDDDVKPPTVRLCMPDFPPEAPNGSIVVVPVGGEVMIGDSAWLVKGIWRNPEYPSLGSDGVPYQGGLPGEVTLVRI